LLGGGVSEGEQAAAVADEGVGALENVPELLPACGPFGVERCRVGVVAGVFGELGTGGAEGVLVERVAGLEKLRLSPALLLVEAFSGRFGRFLAL
jgi:hypothetical protein